MLVSHSHSRGYADSCLWESMTGSGMPGVVDITRIADFFHDIITTRIRHGLTLLGPAQLESDLAWHATDPAWLKKTPLYHWILPKTTLLLLDIVPYWPIWAKIWAQLRKLAHHGLYQTWLVSDLARHDTAPVRSEILVRNPITTLSRMIKIRIASPSQDPSWPLKLAISSFLPWHFCLLYTFSYPQVCCCTC